MSYIGVQPVPKASLILTQGTFGSSSQTITVPGGYQPGNIFVHINGFRLQTSEYTATDGSIIDLGESFPSGTDYIVEEIRSFTIPDHYTKAEIQNASFDFVNMPTVGGDPIVESGSNSDGGWTKFSEGTLVMSGVVSLDDNDSAGKDFTFPVVLANTDHTSPPVLGATGVTSGGTSGSYVVETALISTSLWRGKVLSHSATSITAPSAIGARFHIHGRWK